MRFFNSARRTAKMLVRTGQKFSNIQYYCLISHQPQFPKSYCTDGVDELAMLPSRSSFYQLLGIERFSAYLAKKLLREKLRYECHCIVELRGKCPLGQPWL